MPQATELTVLRWLYAIPLKTSNDIFQHSLCRDDTPGLTLMDPCVVTSFRFSMYGAGTTFIRTTWMPKMQFCPQHWRLNQKLKG